MRSLDYCAHSEDTLFTVQAAITRLGYSGQPVLDLINSIQNAGILFRERVEDGELPQDAMTTYGSRIPSTVPRVPIAAYNLGYRDGRESITSRTGEPEPDVQGWLDKTPEPIESDPDYLARRHGLPQGDDDRDPRIPIHVRMAADADEARQEYGDDKPELTQAEEPIEQRISRAFANGWREGFERAQWGTRWDHS